MQPALPVVPTDYVRFYRSPRFRWWRPVVALLVAGLVWAVVVLAFGVAGLLLDGPEAILAPDGSVRVGPWTFLANNVALAFGIPVVMAVGWIVHNQRPGWLSSVTGRFRWSWAARVALVVLPIWAILIGGSYALGPEPDLSWRDETTFMILAVLLTTPFQAAGEEYLFRGFLSRNVGSWFASEGVAVTVSALVGAAAFTAVHFAADPWLNAYYFTFGLVAAWLTWRTGGLEAAVVIHIINNVLGMVTLPFSDLSEVFDRSVGTGDSSILVNLAFLVGTALLLDWMARRRGVVARSAPGREELEATWAALAARGRPAGW